MQLSAKALAIAFALMWGGAMLCVGVLNLAAPPYGSGFLDGMSSVYPGFHASYTLADVNFPSALCAESAKTNSRNHGRVVSSWELTHEICDALLANN